MDWVAPFACHDYPTGGAPSINSRESTDVSIGKAAEGLAFTRAPSTALEGGLVADAPHEAADAYLQPIKDSSKSVTPWLQAIAKQVPRLKAWWRCVASSMGESKEGMASRRAGLNIMLEAAVTSETEPEQATAVDELHAWAEDWLDREGHLRKVMHA